MRKARPHTTVLGPETAEIYVAMARRLLQAGRLNRFFPDPEGLDSLLRFLAPSGRPGDFQGLELNLRTGFPTERAVGLVLSEGELSEKFLGSLNMAALRRPGASEADGRLLQKAAYHEELVKSRLPRRVRLELALRRIEADKERAYFTTVFERFDPTEELFVRYTVQLYQHHGRWTKHLVELQGDDMEATGPFRNVISRYHADEAEFAFILLSELPAITVEEIVRGRVGPLWFEGVEMPAEFEDLMRRHPGSFLLHFPSERAATTIKEDRNNDPFAPMYRDSLAAGPRELAERKAQALGYRVFKERKFACTRAIAEPLGALLKERGYRCVIYPV